MVAITSFSNVIVSGLNLIGGLLVAKLLLPEDLGLFNSFSIFTSYIILAQIGIPSGLSRELPFLYGKKEIDKAHGYSSAALSFSLLVGSVIVMLCLATGFYFLTQANYEYALGGLIVAITTFQAFYVTKYLKVLYRSNTEFNKLALINIIVAIVSISTVIFVYLYGFYGLGIRVFFIALFDLVLSFFWRPIKVGPKWSFANLKELFNIGAPIYFVSSVYSLWPTVQRTVILSLGGAKALGLYALANIIQNMLNTINNAISTVSFPKMSYAYGKGARFIDLMRIPMQFIKYSVAIYLLIAIVGWYLLPIIVEQVLPEYVDGIEAAQWMLIAALISVFSIFSNIYMVIKKNGDRLKAYIWGITAWGISVLVFLKHYEFDLVIFPKSLIIGYAVTYLADYYFYNKYGRTKKIAP